MIPKIVIVGRPNVGKSSLLNMLASRRVSITDPTPGVTRDRISVYAELPDLDESKTRCVEFIDTGGHGIIDSQDLTTDVEKQIAAGVAEADLILFLIDAQMGVVTLDQKVAQLLREAGCENAEKWVKKRKISVEAGNTDHDDSTPVLLVANKVDDETHEHGAIEASRLGFGYPTAVSAVNRFNRRLFNDTVKNVISDVIKLGGISDHEAVRTRPDTGVLIAMVGKRNAGKSTLVNALAGEDRVIVSEVEGTTRDSVDVRIEIDDKVFTAIDTAGVRKRKSLQDDIEYYSYHRSLRSIRRADVVLFLVDSSVPISQVDKQLSLEMQKHHKPCVIVINKWDLAELKHTEEEYLEYLDKTLQGLSYAPLVFTTASKSEGIADVMAMAENLHKQSGHRVGTGEMNRLIQQLYQKHQPRVKAGKRPKIFYATQVDVHPPTISLFVNDADLFTNDYQRYLLNNMREVLPFSEVPIKLVFRGKQSIPKGTSLKDFV